MKTEELLPIISQAISEKNGSNIIIIDVRGICSLTDYFIIAEGTVDRHVKALAREVQAATLKVKEKPLSKDGDESPDWIVLDYPGIMVYLFTPAMRQHYRLENLWRRGSLVDVDSLAQSERLSAG